MYLDRMLLADLVVRAQNGDRQAANELAETTNRFIFSNVLRFIQHTQAAEDLTQEILLLCVAKLSELRNPHVLLAWLKRIIERRCINYFSRDRPRELELRGSDELLDGDDRTCPVNCLIRHEVAENVRASVQTLRQIDRTVLEGFYFEQRTILQLAQEFSVPEGTIKRRLHVAKRRLGKALR